MSPQFKLLGSLSIEMEGGPSELLKSPKGCALITYLIVTEQFHTRELLADLLWEATSTSQALHNLRTLLNRIHRLVPELHINRTSLAFQPLPETSVDYLTLQAVLEQDHTQIDKTQLDDALRLYRGDLLENFYLEGAPRFNEWLVLERERLRQKVYGAFQGLCQSYAEAGQWASGLTLAQHWLRLDPLNEEAVRDCMQFMAARGEPSLGLQLYETFRQQLWTGFEFDPELTTSSLAARLRQLLEEQGRGMTWEHISAPAFPKPGELAEPGPLPSTSILPYIRNPDFTGRKADLLALAEIFFSQGEPGSPPIAAITGMGGLGKTQLAVEFAYRYGRYFPGGVYWIRFADPDHVPTEIAATGGERGLGLYQDAENLTQIDQVGRVQRAWQEPILRLLIFDNCESQSLLEQWRPVTGGSRILITSRRAEWSRELNLTCLPLNVLSRAESTRLLQSLAPDLDQNYAHSIAAEVGDLPLAIYLAGSFLGRYRQISPSAYLNQLRGKSPLAHPSLQGCGSSYSPTGHELSVARTFALGWNQLNSFDQVDSIARQLLVCAACLASAEPIPEEWLKTMIRPGGDVLTMTMLAEDGLSSLLTLGFLKREAGHMVILHPLLASFTQEASGEEEFGAAQSLVTSSLTQTLSEHLQKNQRFSNLPISTVHWRHISQEALDHKIPMAANLATLLGIRLLNIGETFEAEQVLKRACAAAIGTGDVLVQAQAFKVLSDVQEVLGHFEESLESIEKAVTLYKEADSSDLEGWAGALRQQGRVLHRLERAAAALRVAEEGYAISHAAHLQLAEARFLELMGVVNYDLLAHYNLGQQQLEESLVIYRKLGMGESIVLNQMGENARLQGNYAQAARYYKEAHAALGKAKNQNWDNLFTTYLCGVQIGMGQFESAAVDLEKLIATVQHDWFGLSEVYQLLGEAYLGLGKISQALVTAQNALATAHQSSLLKGRAWRILALVAAELGEPILSNTEDEKSYDAEACFRHSLDFFRQGRSERDRAITLWRWAQVELEQGDKEQGWTMWREARDIFTQLNLPLMVARMENQSSREIPSSSSSL